MNLFEKMFNYQMMTRLNETGLFTWTSQERAWLRMMLNHPAAREALSAVTLDKMHNMLNGEQDLNLQDYLTEKAKSEENSVSHPLLRQLRLIILHHQGFRMTGRVRNGRTSQDEFGFPYKLEYSMVKKNGTCSGTRLASTNSCLPSCTASLPWKPNRLSRIALQATVPELLR